MNFSEAKRTRRRTFTKNIRSAITNIDEIERRGFRIIFLMAYLRMRITIEALENNRKILWKKQEKASENLTGKAKNFTIRSNNHNKYKMD